MFSFTCQKTVSYELSRTFHFKMEKGIFSPMGKKLWPTPSFLVFFIWIADITLELNYSQFLRQLWRVWNLRSKCNMAECHFPVDYWPKTLQINYGDVVNHPCIYDRCLVVHWWIRHTFVLPGRTSRRFHDHEHVDFQRRRSGIVDSLRPLIDRYLTTVFIITLWYVWVLLSNKCENDIFLGTLSPLFRKLNSHG